MKKDLSSWPSFLLIFVRKLACWGLQLRLWVALCVTSLAVFAEQAAATIPLPVQSPFGGTSPAIQIIFFSTLALYNLDGSLDAHSHASSDRPRRQIHWTLTLLSIGAVLWLLPLLPFRARLLTALGFTLSGLYAAPLALRGRVLRLKSLPGLKGPFVGMAVSTAVVWVPALSRPAPIPHEKLFLLSAALALYCTANSLLFDIPDIRTDSDREVPTLARTVGPLKVRAACTALSATALTLWPLGCFYLAQYRSIPVQSSELLSLSVLGGGLILASRRIEVGTSRARVAWIVDGALLLPLSVHWIATL